MWHPNPVFSMVSAPLPVTLIGLCLIFIYVEGGVTSIPMGGASGLGGCVWVWGVWKSIWEDGGSESVGVKAEECGEPRLRKFGVSGLGVSGGV